MTTLTASRVAELPRVNLLPPEIEAAGRLRRLQGALALLLLMVLAGVVMLFVWAGGQVSSAEDELAAAQTEATALQAEEASYAEVPRVLGEVEAAEVALVTAMTPEIRWSFYLNDLTLTIPSSNRLATLAAVNTAADAQMAPETPIPVTPLGVPTMGSITYTGKATDLDASAAWLVSLAKQKGLVEPSAQSVVLGESSETVGTVYDVASGVWLDLEAASERYTQVQEGE